MDMLPDLATVTTGFTSEISAVHDAHAFLQNLALVLCVAAATSVLFKRFHLPVVFGYLIAGMIVGPHVAIPLSADTDMVRTLSELGVILLMYSLGLEFSTRRLLDVAGASGLAALAETTLMMALGYATGRFFGWTTLESLFAAGIVAISSTTIIAKAFAERGVRGKVTDVVFGILIVEDLIAIVVLSLLTALATSGTLSAASLGLTVARLATFLIGLAGIGLLIVPPLMRAVVRLESAETTLVAGIGICFAAALLALSFGYSVALGAFIAGSLVAESGQARTVERLVFPVRDMFIAIFFVSVGMLIDPAVVRAEWRAVLAFTAVVLVGKMLAVSVASFLSGSGLRTSVQTGMSLAQIGEFSFIIAGLGITSGATRGFLYPVAVAVSAVTTLTTPLFIRVAGPVAEFVDRKLPKPMQTFAVLYTSWMERLRQGGAERGGKSRVRRLIRAVILDAVLMVILVVGTAAEMRRLAELLSRATGLREIVTRWVVGAAAVALVAPLLWALVRNAYLLALALAHQALPAASIGRVDFAAAPRRALVVTLQLSILLVVAIPLIAITGPFVPAYGGVALFAPMIIAFGIAFWQSARNLHGHARAGAQVIAEALSQHVSLANDTQDMRRTMEHVHATLPGLGEPASVRIPLGSTLAGRSLAEANLRGLTGATVLAILRQGEQVLVPTGHDVLRDGDVLAIAGTQAAVDAAKALVEGNGKTSRASEAL
jgi:K+:H+ antiporter